MRTLTSAAKNPVNASTPMLPSDANPWMAISEPPDNVTKADDRDRAADDGHRAGTHADLGDEPQCLPAVAAQRPPDLPDAVRVNQAIRPTRRARGRRPPP